jgi:hypothetical protein
VLGDATTRALVAGLTIATGCGRLEFAAVGSDDSRTGDGASADGVIACASWTPWATPAKVPELEGAFGEHGPALRDDGLEVVFARSPTMNAPSDLYHARRATTAEPFGTPMPLAAINTGDREEGPSLSADGLTLYFMNNTSAVQLWRATRATTADAFANAELVPGGPFGEQSDPSISTDGLDLYHGSTFGDLYVSSRGSTSASFGAPALLPTPIASSQWQEGPSISADSTALYWSQVDANGLFVVLVATRPDRASPFGPASLVTEVQTGQAWNPEISADGTTLLFSRFENGVEKIYVTQRSCL